MNTNRWALAASLSAAILFIAAVGVYESRREKPLAIEPPGFELVPEGDEVPRLTPIRVTFPSAPSSREPARLLRLDPPAPGRYLWIGERTLQYQPDFPGLLRGREYTVAIAKNPDAGLPDGYSRRFTTEGILKVEHVIPQPGDSEIPTNAQVLVEFSRSVAPLTVLQEPTTPSPLEIEPSLRGKGEWVNTSLYRFVPEDLQPSTDYRLRVRAGLTSAADGVLLDDYSWTFRTVSPLVLSISPDRTQAGLGDPVVVKFNQPMDRASVGAGFTLTRGNTPVPGALTWSEQDSVAKFTPGNRLDPESRYEVVLPAGLRGARGGVGREERRTTFETVGLPRVTTTRPSDGSVNYPVRSGVAIQFNNPMDPDSFEDLFSISSIEPDKLRVNWQTTRRNREDEGEQRSVSLNASLNPSSEYTVTIAVGGRDKWGQPFEPYTFSFTTAALPSTVILAVPQTLVTYSASGDQLLYYRATNVQEASFSLYALTSDEVRTDRNTPPSRAPIRRWTEPATSELNQTVLRSTALGGLPVGDYFLTTGGSQWGSYVTFSVVNTVLVAKASADELLVWAVEHDTGRPVANAPLSWVPSSDSRTSTPLPEQKATTDARGLASFPVNTPRGSYRNTVGTVRLDHEGKYGLTGLSWSYGAFPFQLGVQMDWSSRREFVGHLYTDRPIYRPGEKVHYKGVLRLEDDASYQVPPASTQLRVVVHDSTRKEIGRHDTTLNDLGTFAGSFTLDPEAPTGEYSIMAQVPSTLRGIPFYSVADINFSVAEFRKPEFQVVLLPSRTSYVAGDSMEATARASFYFGGGVADAPVKWSALSRLHTLRPAGFERYSFSDQDYYRPAEVREVTRAQGAATTDNRGAVAFSLPATITGNEGAQTYQLTTTVRDQNAQEVSANTTVTVHPAELYAGIRPANYCPVAGRDVAIELVTVDTSGVLVPGRRVIVQVYDREWITVKEQSPDGSGGRRYRSEPKDTLIDTLGAVTDAKAVASVTYRPKNAGSLRVVAEVTDSRGRTARSATNLWVSGQGYARWQLRNDDVIQLIADKDEYQVGDVAEVLVPSPYEGMTGLVTVERGRILDRNIRQFPTNSERLRIRIEDRHVPNVFVSVALFRPPTAADPVPRYRVGYVKLQVSTASRVLNVSVQPDRDRTRPGEQVHLDVRVTDASGKGVPAEVSLGVVDKAVLSLAEEKSKTGLRAFWFERGLGISTASSLAVSVDRANDLIVEGPAGGKGGGGVEDDRIRQEFRNTAFWQGQLKTDGDGHASVTVTMPDNLTTWRAQARAVSGDILVGEGNAEIVSTQPLMVRPALPRFLRTGDKVTLRALVQNGTAAPADVQVSLTAEGIEVTGDRSRRATVQPGEAAILEWPATAPEDGDAKLTFTATSPGGLRDSVAQTLPVHLNMTPETTATGGVVRDEPRSEAIYLPHYAVARGGRLQLSAQASLAGSLIKELKNYEPKPWDGPRAIAARIIAVAGFRRAEPRSQPTPESDIKRLLALQRSDGAWAWCTLCSASPSETGWALIALGEARQEGIAIPDSAVARARSYLRSVLSRSSDEEPAFLLYALARAGAPEPSQALALQQQTRASLSATGRRFLTLALVQMGADVPEDARDEALHELNAATVLTANTAHWEHASRYQSPWITALALLALVRTQPDHPAIEETVRWLAANQQPSVGIDNAMRILALSEYMARTGELAAEYAYQATVNGREVMSGRFAGGTVAAPQQKDVPLSALTLGGQSVLSWLRDFTQPGRLYYTLNLRYLTPARDVEAVNRGIAVSHEYSHIDDPARPIDRVKLGETVRVKVTVMAPHDLSQVIVDDLLPGGLEPVDPKLKITDAGTVARLEEERRKAAGTQPMGGCMAPWYGWYYSPWRQVDVRDDRVTLKAERLGRGVYEYIYYARATTAGEFFLPPTHAYQSAFPDVFGRSDSGRFTVEP